MIKTKTILGLSLAAIFAVTMIAPAFADGHLTITSAEVKVGKIEIETAGIIPSEGAFGYGAFTTDGKVVAVTTHGGVGPDSESQVDAFDGVFHTHLVELTEDTGCASGLAVASVSFEEIATVEVKDNKVEIKNITQSLTNTVVSFGLSLELGDICVNPVDVIDTTEIDED